MILNGNKMIHTIGDSHAGSKNPFLNVCFSHLSYMKNHWLGPKLMHSIGRDGLDLSPHGINGGCVIFCFGEIDCRCHVNKFGPDYKQTINEIVSKYFHTLQAIKNKYGEDIFICVFNVVPPVKSHMVNENQEFPFLGDDDTRKNYVEYMNMCLDIECKKNNFLFFNIYSEAITEDGFLKEEDSDGGVHLKNPVYAQNFIEKNLKRFIS
jgi:hypothetical protein